MVRRTLLLSACLLLFLGGLLVAETNEDAIGFGGGGPQPSLLFLDLGDLNQGLNAAGYPTLREVMFMMGGAGYGGLRDGIRFGGSGISGNIEASFDGRSVTLGADYGGVLIEKGVSADRDLTFVLGTLIGGGSLDLRLVKDRPGSFEDAVLSPFVSSMSRDFFAMEPYIAFEVRPLPWAWGRVQLGLLWTLSGPWSFEGVEFSGPPRAFGGFIGQFMVRFGSPGSVAGPEPSEAETPSADDVQDPEVDVPEETSTN